MTYIKPKLMIIIIIVIPSFLVYIFTEDTYEYG